MGISRGSSFGDVNNSAEGKTKTATTTSSIARVSTSNKTGRQAITIQNRGPSKLYAGPTGTTPTDGMIELIKGVVITFPYGAAQDLLVQTVTATADYIVQEES